MIMLAIDDFSPITLDSKKLFDAFYMTYPPVHSDYVFSTMIAWREYAKYEYAFVDDSLYIKTCVDDITRFRPPIGMMRQDTFDQLITLAKDTGSNELLSMVTEDMKSWIQNHYPSFVFTEVSAYDDYVYLSDDLASLEGSEYRKIRNRLNKFVKNFDYEVEPISQENISEVRRFLRRWCIWRDCDGDPLLEYEKKAVMYTTKHFDELKLSGLSIRVNDHIEAIAIYEQMNPDIVVVHFEKGSPYYDGIYKVVNMETAKQVRNSIKYINRESDMGNPGLRKAKKSYRPDHMVRIYQVDRV